jgi:flagellar biosynthetic protein FliP
VVVSLDGEERMVLLGDGRLLDWIPSAQPATKRPLPPAVPASGARGLMREPDQVRDGRRPEDLRRAAIISVLAAIAFGVMPAAAMAQSAVNINLGTGAGLTDRVVQLVGLMTVLSLAPSIVIMTTSFVRIVVVLGLLRTAIGVQQSPPNPVIISLALFLTAIVMGPTFEKSYDAGIKPLLDHQMELPDAFDPPPVR